jgi:ABC-type uncharacterized transport system auxiliary subunit
MKTRILNLMVLGALIAGLSGCMSAEEKKAKDIAVKKIIEDDKKEKEQLAKMKKKNTRDYTHAFGD